MGESQILALVFADTTAGGMLARMSRWFPLVLLASGCGASTEPAVATDGGAPPSTASFACGAATCRAGEQVCLDDPKGGGFDAGAGTSSSKPVCAPAPACLSTDCDCLTKALCASRVGLCSSKDGAVAVRCMYP